MGSCYSASKHDPNVPRCAGNTYPRNPAYANQPQQYPGAPVNVPMSGGGGRDHMGEVIVAGALLSHGGFGVPGPTMHNPISGGYGDVF